jgi:hypothetical protein
MLCWTLAPNASAVLTNPASNCAVKTAVLPPYNTGFGNPFEAKSRQLPMSLVFEPFLITNLPYNLILICLQGLFMPKHFVCYVQRKRITDWKRKVLTREDSAFIYGSRDNLVFPEMKREDVLWVVSPVPNRPPEIVARLNVEIVAMRDNPELGVSQRLLDKFPNFIWFARGDGNSRFYGHNNAEKALMQSTFFTSTGKPWCLGKYSSGWRSEFGKRFQRPVEISTPDGELFQQIADQPAIFISWKWRDNQKRLIRNLAYNLADQGFAVWLDQLAMPASESLKRLKNFPEALEQLLCDGYRHSSILLAIESRNYGTQSNSSAKNWTLDEWNGVLNPDQMLYHCVFRPSYSQPSEALVKCDYRIKSFDPTEAAFELKTWFCSTRSL